MRRWTKDAEVVFGYARDGAEGQPIENLVPFLTERGAELEGWCRRVDGSVFRGVVAALSAPEPSDVLAADGGPFQVLVVTDITSRYMREQAQQRVRERIDAVTTSVAHLAFFSIDHLQDELDVWGAFADVVGWTRDPAPRQRSELMAMVHPEDRESLAKDLDQTIATGAPFEIELRVRSDLGERWLLMAGSLVEGQPGRIVGAAMNITRRRALDERLRASDARLRAVLDATSDGIMMIDARGQVESINAAAGIMFRAAPNELVGAAWPTMLALGTERLPTSGALTEVNGRRSDGTSFALECNFSVLGSGKRRLTIVALRDPAQRSLIERQVLDVSEQLQRQIGQDLHDGLGQLLTGTAFLTKGLQHSLANEFQPQAQRIVELINLAISRVRSLAHGLSPIHVDAKSLEAVLRQTVSEASELLGVACELKLDGYVDRTQPAAIAQLCLIAREALTNAVRHGHAQQIVVRLSRAGEVSSLSVEDDGVGISEIEKPLEGLGLRSMRYRAEMIGGKLEILHTRRGTTVRCTWRDP